MKFKQLYSGSSGNLYEVTVGNGKRLLIDPGVTWAKLQKALKYDLRNIVGCLVTHSHKDHCKAIKEVAGSGIEVYASSATLDASGLSDSHRANILEADKATTVDGIGCYPFATHHDVEGSLGFVISYGNRRLLFATDTKTISQRFKTPFDVIAIECSYDKAVLETRVNTGDINESLAKRLLTSHMEKSNTKRYITEFCDLSRCREIHLLHMSGDNIGDKEAVRKEFEQDFFTTTRIVGDGHGSSIQSSKEAGK